MPVEDLGGDEYHGEWGEEGSLSEEEWDALLEELYFWAEEDLDVWMEIEFEEGDPYG